MDTYQMDGRELLSLSEAARVSGVSRVTVRRYLDAGRFPNAVQMPGSGAGRGQWRVPVGDLRAVGWSVSSDLAAGVPEAAPLTQTADEVSFLRRTIVDLTAALQRQQAISADLARALADLGGRPAE